MKLTSAITHLLPSRRLTTLALAGSVVASLGVLHGSASALASSGSVTRAGSAMTAVTPAPTSSSSGVSNFQTYYFNDTPQHFTVPAGVTEVGVSATGGSGGNGSAGSGGSPSPGGLGAAITANALVNPGDVLDIEVGGAGGTANGIYGGAGGLSSGDGMDGGNGGQSLYQGPGGGGGGGTIVGDENGPFLLAAGGGGGGGGGVTVNFQSQTGGGGGDAGDADSNGGAGYCPPSNCLSPGGQFAASGSFAGGNGYDGQQDPAGGGGGGGGFYDPGLSGGGGLGGVTPPDQNDCVCAAGGGGAGASYAGQADLNVTFGDAPPGNGFVVITWNTPGPQVTLTSSPNPASAGQPITFTVTATPYGQGAPSPTGSVELVDMDTGGQIGNVLLPGTSNDTGSVTVSNLSAGTYRIYAAYIGDSNYPEAVSSVLTQVVNVPIPQVTAIRPATGVKGTLVRVSGMNLTNATAVLFGTKAAKTFSCSRANLCKVVVPGGRGNVDVRVVTTFGESATSPGDVFTYTV